jgi:hypothetical protein
MDGTQTIDNRRKSITGGSRMNDYIKEIEKQNEELRTKLQDAEALSDRLSKEVWTLIANFNILPNGLSDIAFSYYYTTFELAFRNINAAWVNLCETVLEFDVINEKDVVKLDEVTYNPSTDYHCWSHHVHTLLSMRVTIQKEILDPMILTEYIHVP